MAAFTSHCLQKAPRCESRCTPLCEGLNLCERYRWRCTGQHQRPSAFSHCRCLKSLNRKQERGVLWTVAGTGQNLFGYINRGLRGSIDTNPSVFYPTAMFRKEDGVFFGREKGWKQQGEGAMTSWVHKRVPLSQSFKINPLVQHFPGTTTHWWRRENTHRTRGSSQERLCIPEAFPWLPSIDNRLRGWWEKRAFVSHPHPANDSGLAGSDEWVTPQGPLQGKVWLGEEEVFWWTGGYNLCGQGF